MGKDFAFLFKPGDYLRDTQCLSEKSQVAYDRIMCEHMRNICITQQQLNFFTKRLSPDELTELMFLLNKVNGGYEIEWVAESIRERITYSESRRNNRLGKNKEDKIDISKTYDKHMESEGEDEDNIDFKSIVEIYHSLCPKMNGVKVINDFRKGLIRARISEYGLEKVTEVIRIAGESDFLNGKNDKAWKADFEWIMRPQNFIKIMEGKYKLIKIQEEIKFKYYTNDQMLYKLDQAGGDKKFWQDYNKVKLDKLPQPVWVHINDIALYNLTVVK